jgi:hypothetical protein
MTLGQRTGYRVPVREAWAATGRRSLVAVGETLELAGGDYLYGNRPDNLGDNGALRLRVTHLPEGADTWQGDWISLVGVPLAPGGGDGPECVLVVWVRALPGYASAAVSESSCGV